MKNSIALMALMMISQVSHASIDQAWSGVSYPGIMGQSFETSFGRLPLSGHAKGEKKYWSGGYWPYQKGSINIRWNSSAQEGFNLVSPSKEQAMKMSYEELASLSPSEKYDLFTGKYNYPMKARVEEEGDPYADEWEGICHGWAPASMNHNEPTPKVMTNPDGIQIPFGSSDIKALLSYYYAQEFKVANTHQMGRRCSDHGIIILSKHCKEDLNAGAFHIVLTNKIGRMGEAFLADLDRLREVWNHPVVAYETEIIKDNMKPKMNSARGTKKVVRVNTTVSYIDEAPNTWSPVLGTSGQIVETKEFLYDLDLSAYGTIIGGDWKSRERPDFLWSKEKALIWVGGFERLNELLNDDK